MATTTFHEYTGDGSDKTFDYSFPTYVVGEVVVEVDGVLVNNYTVPSYATTGTRTVTFDNTTGTTNTNVCESDGSPKNGLIVRIRRDTGVDTAKATYAAGSAIKAEDLNANQTQILRALQEEQSTTISTTQIRDAAVTTAKIKADNITSALIADDQINSEHIAAGAVDLEHMSANSVDSDQYVDGSIDLAHMSANSVDSDQYVDGSIDTVHIGDDQVTYAKVQNVSATDRVLGRDSSGAGIIEEIAPAALRTMINVEDGATADQSNAEIRAAVEAASDSNVFTDADHSKLNAIEASATADQTAAEIRTLVESASDSNVFTDADHSKLNAIEASATADQTASEIKSLIASSPLDASHLAADSVTTSEIADAELTTLAGMQSGTASILAGGTALTATLAEINTVVDGKSVETTISDTDAAYPTSGAVVDYVAAQIAPIGGLEVIATDAAFPNTQPAAGVVISIADAGGLVVNGSGTSTTGRTVGGSTVTINNIASNFNSTTVDNGVAFMVSSTGSGQIYNYHKATLKEADLLSLSGDINDFAERYRVAGSAPSSSLDEGDLWWDTATDKLKVYDGSAWEEVASSGDFYINTISSYSGTGGNSATFNGSAYRFVLSNPGSSAQQHVVSINGVIQKPNSGTSQPSEGFVIDGSSIIFSNAPATGSDYFILTLGTTVSIGTPSDNTVSTAKIQNLAVTGDKIATNLDLADSKKIRFGTGNDLEIYHDGSNSYIANATNNLWITGSGDGDNNNILIRPKSTENSIKATGNGAVELYYDNSKKLETTSSGVTLTGDVFFDNATNAGNDITWDMSDNLLEFTDDTGVSFGDGKDLQIYHDGTDSIIKNTTGNLDIITGSTSIDLKGNDGSETLAKFSPNGAVDLYYNNIKTFNTNGDGISVLGTEGGSAVLYLLADEGDDNADKFRLVVDDGGGFFIQNVKSGSWETNFKTTGDGNVELYYDGSKKLETTSDGVTVTGTGYVSGGWRPSSSGGASLGSSSYRWYDLNISNDIDISDNGKVLLGDGDDLRLWHDGTNSYITNSTGHINIQGKITENSIICKPDAAVEFYYDGTKKFETHADGLHIGDGNNLDMPHDSAKIVMGAGDDLQIYHDGSHSRICAYNTGNLLLKADSDIKLEFGDEGGATEKGINAIRNGAVELYHNDSKVLWTDSNGFNSQAASGDFHFNFLSAGGNQWGIWNQDNNMRFMEDSTERMRIYSSGNIGAPTGSNIYNASDQRLKKNITTLTNGLDKIKSLNPVSFNWIDGWCEEEKDKTLYGVIAQEAQVVDSNLVNTFSTGKVTVKDQTIENTLTVNEKFIIPLLIKAVQELSAEVETLKTKVAALEAK